uniref:Uncharacterized protein n=1 Tax=Arundo donax TaxID=35708 RepID=A0A0A9E7C7_ARUDO
MSLRSGSVHSAFNAINFLNTTLPSQKITSLQNSFLSIPPLNTYPLSKLVLRCHQFSFLS